MAINDKILQLYNAMKADGADVGTEQEFNDYFLAKGDQGYKNRKAVWDAFKADGADVGDSYEEFAGWLGLQAVKPQQKPQQPVASKPQQKVTPVQQPQHQTEKPQPMQFPEGFGQLDLKQAQRMQSGTGYNPWQDANPNEVVSAHGGNGKPQPKPTVNTTLDKDLKSGKQNSQMKQVQDQLEYQQMTGKQLGDDRVKNFAWEAPTLVRNEQGEVQSDENGNPLVGLTTEQERVERYQQDLKDRERNAIVKSAVDKLQQDMEADAKAKYGEAQKDNGLTPEFAVGDAFGGYIQYLKDSSPEELLNRLNKAYDYEDSETREAKDEELRKQGKSTVLAHWDDKNKQMDFANRFLEDNRDAIEQAAGKVGMNVEDYVLDELVPQLAGDIAQRYQSNMSEKYSVKDTADYLARMMGNSMIGTLATMGATTKKTRQFLQEEQQKSREGKGAQYNSNMGTNLLGETMMFAADAAPLMVGGAIGGLTSKAVGAGLKQLGWSELGALVSSSSPFLAANVGRAMKYGGLALGSVARGVGSMAPFMAASSAVQDLSTGDGTLASIGRAAIDGAWEGAKFGAATGVFGVGRGALGSKVGRVGEKGLSIAAKRAAYAGAAFLVENQIFAGLDYIKDPENFNWVESTEDAFYMQLAGKFASTHGAKNTMDTISKDGFKKTALKKFAQLFAPRSANEPIRLNDTDRTSIQRAFGGMDFVDIASDVNNIWKILDDKQNIPWTTRMKVSAQVQNASESSRPRTARIKINGYDKTISEIAQNGDLIEVHKYDNADDLLQTRVAIEDRRKNDDMLADFAKLDMQEKAKPILEGFAQEYGLTNEELWKIMQKKPIERVNDEQDLMDDLAMRLHEAAYPKGEKHIEQSAIDGQMLAGDSAEMNPDTASAIAQELAEAKDAFDNFPMSEDMRLAVQSLGDARLDDLYMYVRDNFSGPEADEYLKVIADYANAQAKQQGYIEKTGANIDEQVSQDVDEKSFHGLLDGQPDDANIITVTKDGEDFILVNGNLGTTDGVTVNPETSSGQIILRGQDGRFVPTKPDALMTISSREAKDAYAARVREQLQVNDTQTAIETGLVQPKAEAKPQEEVVAQEAPGNVVDGEKIGEELDNAGGEAGESTVTGANEPSATSLSKIPTLKDEQGAAILDEEGDPQYQWDKAPLEDTLAALSEISGGDRNTVVATVDAMVGEATKEVDKVSKLTPKGKDPIKIARNAAEIKAQQEEAQRKLEYWTQAKQELEKVNEAETNLNVEPVENNEPEVSVPLQPKAASEQKKAKTADEKRAERVVQLKQQYGEHFNDDFSKALSAEELASMYVGRNRTLSREDLAKELGYKLGLNTDEPWAETLLAKKGEGKTLWEVAHDAYESDENPIIDADGTRKFSEEEIHDALINVFREAKEKSDVMDYAINSREELAKIDLEAAQRKEEELREAGELGNDDLTEEEAKESKRQLPFPEAADDEIPESPAIPDKPIEEKDVKSPNLKETYNEVSNEIKARRLRVITSEEDVKALEEAGVGSEIIGRIKADLEDPNVTGRYVPELGEVLLYDEHIKNLGLNKDEQKAVSYHENIHGLERYGYTKEDFADTAHVIEWEYPELGAAVREDHNNLAEEAQNEEIVAYYIQGLVMDGHLKELLDGTYEDRNPELTKKIRDIFKLLTNKADGRTEEERTSSRVVQPGESGRTETDGREGEESNQEWLDEATSEVHGESEQRETSERDEYLKPRNEKEEKIISDVEQKLAEEIKAAEDEVRKAKSELEKAKAKESDRATDMFSDDKAFKQEGQLFESEDMPTDRTAEGVEKRTKVERDAVAAAEKELERLKSQAEHDSRVRGALENERKQTSFDEIDKRHEEEYDKYIKPLLDKSDEELKQLKKEKEDAVGGDLKQLAGDEEYSAINLVLTQREVDKQVENHKKEVHSKENLERKKKSLIERAESLENVLRDNPSDKKAQEELEGLKKRIAEIDKELNPNPMQAIEQNATEFKEEKKEEAKQIGITFDDTPEQIAKADGNAALNDPTPLTEEEINNSSLSNVQKTWAKAYLKGNTENELYLEAYLEAYEDVRNKGRNSETNRTDADGTQLVGTDDNQEQGSGQPGRQTGELAAGVDVSRQGLERPESEGVQRSEDSKDNLSVSSGEGSDSGVSESEPKLDGVSSGSERPTRGGTTRSGGRDVRSAGTGDGSSRVAGQVGERDVKTRRNDLKNKRDELLARMKELKDKEKSENQGKLQMALLPPIPSGISDYIPKDKEQRAVFWELATTTAEYGYTYLEEGVTKFNEWKKKIYEDFVEPIKDFFGWGENETDRYIQQVWNSEYEINGVTRTMSEWASFLGEKNLKKVVAADRGTKYEQQKAAESVEVKTGDIDNIRESLPYLLPEQQDDVLKAETQFFDESHQDREHGNGKGMMFTNGTGTGKTYTGLGIVKRFVKQGKGRVLILTPSQEKVRDWANDGLNLGLEIEKLDDVAKITGTTATKSKGKGVVVTTYANARQNLALLEDCFDLIVYDESHKIAENKEGERTTMTDFHEMLTNKNVEKSIDRQTYWLPEWIEHRNLLKEADVNRERLDILRNYADDETVKVDGNDVVVGELKAKLNARMVEITNRLEELRPIMQEIRESKRPQAEIDSKRTKTVFLSATPFNVRESLGYAEGYLFSYPEEDKNTIGSYNHRSPEEAFMEQMFPAGYRWRYGRLEQHVANAEALGRQEIDFSDYLQNTLHTLSGRMIDSDYDYSRDFPILTLDNAGRFNQAMSEVYRNKKYQPLAEIMHQIWNYNDATSLFEAMKTSLVNERIKEHLARGQKVVVFHRRRTSRDIALPFHRAMDLARAKAENEQDTKTKNELLQAAHDFEENFKDIFDWEETIDYTLPREQIERRFGKDKVAFFSGAESKNVKHKSVEEFMKDNGGKDIIVIQEASGKEGISLHDQTGKHQRVEINLALPQSPIAFIQIEGRIYRIGQKSNAIFEYPLLGLDLETNLFAQKFNGALGTTENLALGSKARNLRKSIANSVLENTGEVEYERQGFGGKDMDGRVSDSADKDAFDNAIQDYYGNQKIARGRDNREGLDYFPTPEPIGYKMVEWAQLMDGETALEPSAGHGAIARYVPETNALTAVEPSANLFSKLQMRAGGPGRRFEEMQFEDYPLANKHDAILMNPPYGIGGKTAMEHVAKAFRHLNEGGRLIAIIPDGPAMEKRVGAWLDNPDLGGAAVVTGEIKLPDVAFGRAGTNVRTRILVIDKVTRPEMRSKVPQKVMVDLSNENEIGGLFEKIRDVRMPERTIDQVAINEKRAKRTEKQLNDNPFVNNVYIGKVSYSGKDIMRVSTKAGGTAIDMDIDLARVSEDYVLDKYEDLKAFRDHPEKLDYGKWERRSFGSGKNKVPALDAIRDYCETAIKTLENVSKMTADQMEKRLKEVQDEAERKRQEREAEIQRLRDEREREKEEKIKSIVETALSENPDNPVLTPQGIEYNLKTAYGNLYLMAEKAKRNLKAAGIDWETGHKIDNNEPVNNITSTVVSSAPRKLDYEYKLDKNTRTGEDMHLVNYGGTRLSDADYRAVERKAKAQNGYFNRFKKAWHFPTEADARRFVESMNGTAHEDGTTTRFRLREKEAPKKTKKVYKLMRLGGDGKLYPLFIDSAAPTELGKWYDADSPNVKDLEKLEPGFAYKIDKNGNVVESKPVNRTKTTITGLPNVQKINDATNEESRWITVTNDKKGTKVYHNVGINGSGQPGTFAMRPGWHAGSLPSMRQIGKGKDRNLRDDKFVWVEGEVPADVDYQNEANNNPFKDIPTHIPEDGYYMKATNANKEASQADRIGWYVAGSFKPNRIMSDSEARKAIDDWNAEHPDQKVEYDFDRESGRVFNAETMQLEEPVTTRFSKREKSGDIKVTPDEYAKISHQIATYPKKAERGHVFTDNNYYLCTDIDKEGNFKVIATLPIEGNEDLINEIRKEGKRENFIAIPATESTTRIVSEIKRRGGSTSGDDVSTEELRFRTGGDASVSMGQQANAGAGERQVDFDRKEKAGRKLAEKLNSDFEAVTSLDQIKNKEVRDAISAGNEVPGWIEIGKDGKKKIYLYLPHVRDTYDAEKTIAHETIGHYGLRELLGEKGYKSYCKALLYDLKDPELQKYWLDNLAKNGFDSYRTVDEFLAEAAEKGYGDLSMWQKVKNAMTDALRSAGFTMSPSISDVKYMVWLSKHNLEKGNLMNQVEREALLYRLGKERYEAQIRNGEYGYDHPLEGKSSPSFPGEGTTLFRMTPSVKNQRRNYERALNRYGYAWKEAHVDAMQAAVELMRSISGVKKIEDIPSAENFVLLENQMSSKEEQMDYLLNRDLMEPLDEAVAKCLPDMAGKGIDEQLRNLQLYMIKKHGLERNRVLFVRDALRDLRKTDKARAEQLEQNYDNFMRNERNELNYGNIDLREYHEDVDSWIKKNIDPAYKPGEKDYSGLTSLYGKGFNDTDVVDEVMSTETMLGDERVSDLWDKTKALSQFGLDMEYEGGIDSKEKHDKVSEMFEWYVPLRGYDEKTAEEVYDYLEENVSDGRKWSGPVLMNAKGRESLADVDVFANLGAMSSNAINRSLRNQMKQAFARFVRQHYNDVDADKRLVTELPAVWAEKQYDPVTGKEVWVEKFPDIPENAKADDIAAILDQYQQDMEAKQAAGDAKRIRQNSDIPFRPASKEHRSQHIVDVWINGEKHSFVINGNPRAAQAINGQLKAERRGNFAYMSTIKNGIAKLATSYNPDFIISNAERDAIFSATAIGIKESPAYFAQWVANYYGRGIGRTAAGIPLMKTNLFNRYRNNELNMANPTDRYFKEFMENGGETGWVESKNIDKWKKLVKENVENIRSRVTKEDWQNLKNGKLTASDVGRKLVKGGKDIFDLLPHAIEVMNERAENMARFATYMTSRQMGRSITRSVSDAKEVSVNFNRKGAGYKTHDVNKSGNLLQRMNALVAARTAQYGQDYIMFYNAGVQGLNNASKLFRDHPIKASTAFTGFALGAFIMSWLNQSLIDSEDEKERDGIKNPYAELPEYIRRNNLCLYTGNGSFLYCALPIELRAMYGIGDMAAGYTEYPELKPEKPIWEDVTTQLTQILPIDFMGEHPGNPIINFMPSSARPIAEIVTNQNWYGRPIEKESYGNDSKPRHTRAYRSVNKAYMSLAKRWNAATNNYSPEQLRQLGVDEAMIAEADANQKGLDGWLTDPSIAQHLVESYFAGLGKTAGNIAHVFRMATEDDATWGDVLSSDKTPILRKFHYSPTEQNKQARTRNKWFYYKDQLQDFNTQMNSLKQYGAINPIAKMKEISAEDSLKATKMQMMKDSVKAYNRMKKKADHPKASEQQKEAARMRMEQIMQNTVMALDSIQ